MKMKLLALCALLSVADVFAQQKFMFPIGSNVNNRPAEVSIIISSLDTWARMEDAFSFHPSMGRLEDVVKQRVKLLAGRYAVPHGFEQGEFALNVQITPGPSSQSIFRFQQFDNKWTVPPEVLEVKLHYGTSWVYPVKGAKEIRMQLFKGGQQIAFFSTANPNDSYGFDLSPCSIGATQDAFARDEVRVSSKYIVPSLWDGKWDYGEIDIAANTEDYAVVNLLNGSIIQYSTLEFLESIRAQEMPQAPVLVTNSPKITSLKRVFGEITEIMVEGTPNTSVAVEWTEQLNGEWQSLSALVVPLALNTNGRGILTHKNTSATGFYRVRSADSSSPQ